MKDDAVSPVVGVMLLISITVIIAGISELFFSGITNIILVVGFVPGFSVMVYALLKYNKGIF